VSLKYYGLIFKQQFKENHVNNHFLTGILKNILNLC
jgi:hypothetical protein